MKLNHIDFIIDLCRKEVKTMDWIKAIQKAIDYIEENITEELDYYEISKIACSSTYHFQRIFGVLCGYTLGEYIRARRLTLAGSELASSDIKIIDVAVKYGYDSSESFCRAFSKFHGITPSQAKLYGSSLKLFSKLTVKLILEGGSIMNYRIEEKKAFKVIEKVKVFDLQDNAQLKDIPKFWTQSRSDGTVNTLCQFFGGTDFENLVMGICYGDNRNHEKKCEYSIATGYKGGNIPEGFRVNEIPENIWAIFKCKGKMPNTIQELWRKIYTEFFPTSDYAPKNEIDFEVYPDGDVSSDNYESEIWIAVEKK